ncbi:hypothetical protein C8J56DRAFT_1115236 [Mycena floridula]|nr:hypothetical protein C8J56DRAFT_1115236 [Mycena floridula]
MIYARKVRLSFGLLLFSLKTFSIAHRESQGCCSSRITARRKLIVHLVNFTSSGQGFQDSFFAHTSNRPSAVAMNEASITIPDNGQTNLPDHNVDLFQLEPTLNVAISSPSAPLLVLQTPPHRFTETS